jgi:putative transcription factor
MLCELCGQEAPFLKPLLVEGSLLKVCPSCAKFGSETSEASGSGTKTGGRIEVDSGSSGNSSEAGSKVGYKYSPGTPTKEEIIKRRLEQRERRRTSKDIFESRGDKELAIDYHKRIQQARTAKGWNQEELGQKINERKSVISKIENKSMKPDDRLVRKLEKALGIKLMEVIE